ncbi:MoaD/ThiS family protein [Streptomyces sp. NPDC101150]|uniref:MoaD/ThiS family protein n=1 Tax=Streptomyces sp. NPDC101150 TaxID=3366114 RepID=UPI0038193B07
MSVTVRVPTILRSYTAGAAEVTASGATVVEVLESLEGRFPGIRDRITDEDGEIRRFVNVYLGDEDIRFAEGVRTAVTQGAVMSVIPAVAGGSEAAQLPCCR